MDLESILRYRQIEIDYSITKERLNTAYKESIVLGAVQASDLESPYTKRERLTFGLDEENIAYLENRMTALFRQKRSIERYID